MYIYKLLIFICAKNTTKACKQVLGNQLCDCFSDYLGLTELTKSLRFKKKVHLFKLLNSAESDQTGKSRLERTSTQQNEKFSKHEQNCVNLMKNSNNP